jgi:hypothetical protein
MSLHQAAIIEIEANSEKAPKFIGAFSVSRANSFDIKYLVVTLLDRNICKEQNH